MKFLDDYSFHNKRALVRVDFNVPLDEDFNITDETRINACIPTIRKIVDDGGVAVLMSHLGRPKNGHEDRYSLHHLVDTLSAKLGTDVIFAGDCIGQEAYEKTTSPQPSSVILLDNLRFYKEETKGDAAFAEKLAKHGDVYVNDAFGTAHRAHASTAIVAQYFEDKVCGYVMQKELENAKMVFEGAKKPFTAIMGGAKISDKIMIIERLLDTVDNLLIGGGMTYTFVKAQGGNIGSSLCEEDKLDMAKDLIDKAQKKGVKLILPVDTIAADKFDNGANQETIDSTSIQDGWMGLDIGPKAIAAFSDVLKNSKTILWNGPMGVFEMPNFANGTESIAKAVVAATAQGAFSLIGGGDSAAAVNNLGFGDQVSYVSTGGGALLEFMEGKILPGVAALEA